MLERMMDFAALSPSCKHSLLRQRCPAGLPAVAAKQRRLVPVEGIEPPLLAEHDFESCASTSSATRACGAIYIRRPARRAKRKSACPGRACFRLKDRSIAGGCGRGGAAAR